MLMALINSRQNRLQIIYVGIERINEYDKSQQDNGRLTKRRAEDCGDIIVLPLGWNIKKFNNLDSII